MPIVKFYEATQRKNLEIYDRVGGGNSFASGLIYVLLTKKSTPEYMGYGAAHSEPAMLSPGNTTMVTFAEVEKVMQGDSASVAC